MHILNDSPESTLIRAIFGVTAITDECDEGCDCLETVEEDEDDIPNLWPVTDRNGQPVL